MTNERVMRVWAQVGKQSQGAPATLAHICAAAVAGVNVDGAGVTIMSSSTVRDVVHTSDRIAADLEEWQLTFGQGPCVDAFAGGGPVIALDLRSPDSLTRWPVFTPAALDSGARAVFALPLQIGAIRLGVLDLYRARPGPMSSYELADALAFADATAMMVIDDAAGLQPDTAELAWQRDDPTAHQVQVHQATGMIVAQLGTSAEAAFARLRAYAYAHDRRLGDVARDVVERRLRFEPDPPGSYERDEEMA
ncbi:ANTAR domain-containing protein [Catellatospora paridis]|uniref:ANTAR domain-containing protein n=1 Tax=Catellatospora paridis TaxID=1617086 RepID=UPI001E28CF5C|nr:ANTAR domain-containing protein [Catellatospora paridis]